MKTSTLQLLPQISFGVPSGDYDGASLIVTGDAVKAAGYYSTHGTLQSVALFTTGLLGNIEIQATVDSDSATAKWFTVHTFTGTAVIPDHTVQNITGRFTWIRAKVNNFTAGVVNKVTVSY